MLEVFLEGIRKTGRKANKDIDFQAINENDNIEVIKNFR